MFFNDKRLTKLSLINCFSRASFFIVYTFQKSQFTNVFGKEKEAVIKAAPFQSQLGHFQLSCSYGVLFFSLYINLHKFMMTVHKLLPNGLKKRGEADISCLFSANNNNNNSNRKYLIIHGQFLVNLQLIIFLFFINKDRSSNILLINIHTF